jgi:hypothetical protein
MLQFPRVCQNELEGVHRHLTRRGQYACDVFTAANSVDAGEGSPAWASDHGEPAWEREDRLRAESKAKEAAAAHVTEVPESKDEQLVTSSAERQLLGPGRRWLDVFDLTLTVDIYRINRDLRAGTPLTSDPGAMLDWNGYTSLGHFHDDAMKMFSEVGEDLTLDGPVRAYRGIGIPPADFWGYSDPFGIGAHLRGGDALSGDLLVDPGYGFAALDEDLARSYDGSDGNREEPEFKVLLDIEVHRALCVSSVAHRSRELVELLHNVTFLSNAPCQLILPPGSQFRVLDVEEPGADGWMRVRIRQVVDQLV